MTSQWSAKVNVYYSPTPTNASFQTKQFDETSKHNSLFQELAEKVEEAEDSAPLVEWGSQSTLPDLYLPGSWGTQSIEEVLWDEKKKPYVTFRRYEDLKLDERESEGILTDRIIAACSSYLDRSPETGKYVLCKVDLSRKNLSDISIITFHHFLQYVDLSWNQLTDAEALGQLPFLMYLDASHNLFNALLEFKAPFNLTFVNYSNNAISYIPELENFWSIVHLDLSYNQISKITGLNKLKYLRHLNLSHNSISRIENLSNMRLLSLNLKHNCIDDYEDGDDIGLKTLSELLYVNLGYNLLTTLKLFEELCSIQTIKMASNCIEDLMEINYLRHLNYLSEADFRNNPIATVKFYMDVCLSTIKYLSVLDGETMDAERKVAAKAGFEKSAHYDSMKNSAKSLFLQQINDPIMGSLIIPCDQPPPPIIVLVGPPGSSKSMFLSLFCTIYQRYTVLGVSHTTRPKNETEKEAYYYISLPDFLKMVHKGEFIETSHVLGYAYGIANAEIEKVIGKAAVLMLHMDLTGALTLRAKGYRCRLVLAMPSTAEIHHFMLLQKYSIYSDDSVYEGASEVENSPAKAREGLVNQDYYSKIVAVDISRGILNEMLELLKTDKDITESCEIIDKNEDGDNSVKLQVPSVETVGILKTTATNKAAEIQRMGVTFQQLDNTKYFLEQLRNVNCNDFLNSSKRAPPTSISDTLLSEYENVILSVLSYTKIIQGRYEDENLSIKNEDLQNQPIKSVLDEIIESRDMYLEAHYSNPGLFSDVIFTDDPKEAFVKLQKLLKECITAQPNIEPMFEYSKDTVYKTMVATRLQSLHQNIKSHMTTVQNPLERNLSLIPLPSQLNESRKEVIKHMNEKHKLAKTYKLPEIMKYDTRVSEDFTTI